jgi:uncharacterized membrane protein YgcG
MRTFLIIVSLAIMAAGVALAEETTLPSGYPYIYGTSSPDLTRIDAGGYSAFIHKHGVCRYVANTAGADLMVPFRTAEEWSSFRGAAPAGVLQAVCCGFQSVAYCGEEKTISQVWTIGGEASLSFGYDARVTYTCTEHQGTGVWAPVSVTGSCEEPPPPSKNELNDSSSGGDESSGGSSDSGSGGSSSGDAGGGSDSSGGW